MRARVPSGTPVAREILFSVSPGLTTYVDALGVPEDKFETGALLFDVQPPKTSANTIKAVLENVLSRVFDFTLTSLFSLMHVWASPRILFS
jgi:hypothetical protein